MKGLHNQQDKEDIINRLRKLTGNEKALWGLMTVDQMLCHCADQLRLALGEITLTTKVSPVKKFFIRIAVFYVMPKFPKNAPTAPQIDQAKGGGTKPANFDADRDTLINYIEQFASKDTFAYHALFGNLNKKHWSYLAQQHLDHHLRQFGA